MDKPKLDLEKPVTNSQENGKLDRTTEKNQELEAIVYKVMAKELEKMESRMNQLLQKISTYEEEAQQRHKLILESQKKSKSVFAKLMSKFNSKK